jgi:hypothetical protein
VGLSWVGLSWVGLSWVGLSWVGLSWVGLSWVGLSRVGGLRLACLTWISWNFPRLRWGAGASSGLASRLLPTRLRLTFAKVRCAEEGVVREIFVHLFRMWICSMTIVRNGEA